MKSKKEILRLAKLRGACQTGYTEYKNARGKENYTVLLKHIRWLLKKEILNVNDIKVFIGRGVDIHTCEDKALRVAADSGNLKLVKWLVEHGADIHVWEDYALTAIVNTGNLELVKWLVEWLVGHGVPVETVKRMIYYANERGDYKIVEYIEKKLAG